MNYSFLFRLSSLAISRVVLLNISIIYLEFMREERVTKMCSPSLPLRKMSYEYDGQRLWRLFTFSEYGPWTVIVTVTNHLWDGNNDRKCTWPHVTQHSNYRNTSVPQLRDKEISSHRRINNPDGPWSWYIKDGESIKIDLHFLFFMCLYSYVSIHLSLL